MITGESGSGKTTLLSIIGGLLKPDSGEVNIGTKELTALNPSQTDQFRGRNIGFVLQQAHFIDAISARQNLMLTQRIAGIKSDGFVDELLEELNIFHKRDSLPARLSVGEKQRLSIARALVNKPSVILADEPTSSLDHLNCTAVIELLQREAFRHSAALVIVTHDDRLKSVISNQVNL